MHGMTGTLDTMARALWRDAGAPHHFHHDVESVIYVVLKVIYLRIRSTALRQPQKWKENVQGLRFGADADGTTPYDLSNIRGGLLGGLGESAPALGVATQVLLGPI